jgi:hypothetical protein
MSRETREQQAAAWAAQVDAYTDQIAASFPPMTEEQLDVLAALLGDQAPARRRSSAGTRKGGASDAA